MRDRLEKASFLSSCDGEGLIQAEETVRVHVPPMVGDGTLIAVSPAGLGVHDLYLSVLSRGDEPLGQNFDTTTKIRVNQCAMEAAKARSKQG